jgi:hypothetical protein
MGVQSGSPGSSYSAPFAGVITSWSHQAGPTPTPLRLKVARPVGGNEFTIIGESSFHSPTPNQLNTYADVRVPVRAGDVLGLSIATSGGDCIRTLPGYELYSGEPDAPPGMTVAFSQFDADFQMDVSASLEPDCDQDGFGDDTQDSELPLGEACGKGNRTLTLDANRNKVKKGKKVTLSGRLTPAARQGPCESGQTVELQRKRPKQTTYTTFTQVQTNADGSFSLKQKVKKTFEFRAQVVETAACTAALSNSEKVKVKKKK